MKKFILLIIFCGILSYNNAAAQSVKEIAKAVQGTCEIDDNGNVTYSKIFEIQNKSKDELYDILRTYFAYTYHDANEVIQVADKSAGLIVAKGLYYPLNGGKLSAKQGGSMGAWHIVRADVKDNRVRIIISLTNFEFPAMQIMRLYYSIAEACPISSTFKNRSFYTKMYYRSHQRVLNQFAEIDRTLKDGNTSTRIEKSDW